MLSSSQIVFNLRAVWEDCHSSRKWRCILMLPSSPCIFRVLWASNNVELDKFDTRSQLSNLFVIIFLCYSKKCMASDWALLCPADLLSIEVEKVGDGSINSSTVQRTLCSIHPTSWECVVISTTNYTLELFSWCRGAPKIVSPLLQHVQQGTVSPCLPQVYNVYGKMTCPTALKM